MSIKKRVYSILTVQPFNFLITWFIKIFSNRLPFFFPVVGRMKISLSDSIVFYMKSDGSDSIASRLYLYGPKQFELESLTLFARLLKLDSIRTVVDAGANTGVYSLIAAASDSSIMVHSFEPMPKIHLMLTENVSTNSFENVYVNDLALSDQIGEMDFYFVPAITLPTGGSAAKKDWPGVESFVVKAVTLDFYFEKSGLQSIDLIKLDTEMTEFSILSGAHDVISHCKPIIICEVLDDNSAKKITLLMQLKGYYFYHIRHDGIYEMPSIKHDSSFRCANYMFVHGDRLYEIEHLL